VTLKTPNPHVNEDAELESGPADGHEEWERRMLKYYGLRPKDPKLARCPRIVAGKRCLLGNPGPAGSLRTCICHSTFHSLTDHRGMWRDALGRTVLTWEPYGIYGADFTAVVGPILALGLEILIESYSPYYPGHTVLVIIRQDFHP
jgi:hypothetical protein